ncbi:MAG: TraB/GumN family protein, partial [Candidatus Woesearchaeota archaeon]
GFKGWLFAIIGAWLERSLGKKVGTVPGSEMLKAVQLARELRIPIVLIDQDITITLKRLSEAITWKEKWHLLLDVFGALLFRHGVDFDISGVPSKRLLEKLISHVKARYPNIFRVIVEERNEFMAKALSRILFKFRKKPIVAVVGAGHEAEVLKLVKRYLKQEFETTLKKR